MKRTLFLVLISSIALEAHALRCNHRIVTVGDYDFEVAERCGEPDYVHTRAGYPYRLLSHHALHRPVIDYLPLAVRVNE
ncbi:MAG: DUF2845 domain-containing protein, partial [Gammaproteobacteria bacterium]